MGKPPFYRVNITSKPIKIGHCVIYIYFIKKFKNLDQKVVDKVLCM